MGDVRFTQRYHVIRAARDAASAIRDLSDEGVVEALAAAAEDPYLANVLATEAANRMRRARAVTEGLADGVVTVDHSGRVSSLNPAGEALLGRKEKDVRGVPFLDACGFADVSGGAVAWPACPLRDVIATGVTVREAAARFTRRDGRSFRVTYTASPTLREDAVDGAVVLFRDASATRGGAEDAVVERDRTEAILVALADTVPQGCAIVDAGGRVIHLNAEAVAIGQTTPEVAVGRSVLQSPWRLTTRSGDPVAPDERPFSQSLATGEPVRDRELILHREDGSSLPVSLSAMPVKDANGVVFAVVTLIRDDTETRRDAEEKARLRQDLGRRIRELSAAYEELDAFSYSASHDLRAPLRAIEYLASALLEDHGEELPAGAQDYVHRMGREAARMTTLVNDLLLLSRVSRQDLHREDVDLSAMAREIVQRLQERDPERVVDVHVADDIVCRVDPGLVRVLMENVIGNAWKYSARAGSARIAFGAEEHDGRVTCFVSDNGIGFSTHEAEKVFHPFQRLPSAGGFQGTGIGLAIVKRIADRHDGRVWAEGRPGAGATFRFTL